MYCLKPIDEAFVNEHRRQFALSIIGVTRSHIWNRRKMPHMIIGDAKGVSYCPGYMTGDRHLLVEYDEMYLARRTGGISQSPIL